MKLVNFYLLKLKKDKYLNETFYDELQKNNRKRNLNQPKYLAFIKEIDALDQIGYIKLMFNINNLEHSNYFRVLESFIVSMRRTEAYELLHNQDNPPMGYTLLKEYKF